MNTAHLMLGANINAPINIALAQEKLGKHFILNRISSTLTTTPVGAQYNSDFLNIAVEILSFKSKEETISALKKTEIEMGRTPESKRIGQIPIDIDLISWNNIIEHADYYKFDFVRKCIDELIKANTTS